MKWINQLLSTLRETKLRKKKAHQKMCCTAMQSTIADLGDPCTKCSNQFCLCHPKYSAELE